MNLGSNVSRKPSPNKLNPNTPSKSAKPGAITSQGANSIMVRPSFNILPQEGCGGSVPNPNLLDHLYTYAWFVTFVLSFVFYLAFMRKKA